VQKRLKENYCIVPISFLTPILNERQAFGTYGRKVESYDKIQLDESVWKF